MPKKQLKEQTVKDAMQVYLDTNGFDGSFPEDVMEPLVVLAEHAIASDAALVEYRARFAYLRSKLMLSPVALSDKLGLPFGWCGTLEEAVDAAMTADEKAVRDAK